MTKNDLSEDLGVSGSTLGIATILLLALGVLLGYVVLAHIANAANVAAAAVVMLAFVKPGYYPVPLATDEDIADALNDERIVVIAEDVLSEEEMPFPPKLTIREKLERKCPLPFERLG